MNETMADDNNSQPDRSLPDITDDFGSTEVIERVCDKYEHLTVPEVLFGEPLPTPHVKRAFRSYDHGQASNKQVREWGVRIRFDRNAVELNAIKPNGDIYTELADIADDGFTNGLQDIDIHVDSSYYEVWLIADSDTKFIKE